MIRKIFRSLITDIYKIDIIRTTIVVLRFYYFYHIRKKMKYHMDPNKKIDDHIYVNNSDTVIEHNMHFDRKMNLKKFYGKYNGAKTTSLVYPFKSIDFINYKKSKILSVGPRNEGELYLIRSLGFLWKNIFAIDLFSYSKLIKLGDIHDSKYSDSSFDIIVCGWVLSYSNNFEKIFEELLRITKDGGLISIGFTYVPNIEDYNKHNPGKNVLNSTEQILKKYNNNIMYEYVNIDAYNINPKEKRHSILVIRIKK